MKKDEFEVMLDLLKRFRKKTVNARCLAESPKEAYMLSEVLDAADNLIEQLTEYNQ